MNLKLKAVLYTACYVVSGLVVGFVMSQLPTVVVGAIAISAVLYLVYTVVHAGLKYDEAVKEISKKYEK